MEVTQVKHLERRRKAGEHRESFENQSNRALKVVTSIVRFGLDPEGVRLHSPRRAVELAQDAAALKMNTVGGIRQSCIDLPPLPSIRPGSRPSCALLIRRPFGVNWKGLAALEIVAEHREDLREAVEEEPTAEGLRELALAELAMAIIRRPWKAARRRRRTRRSPDGRRAGEIRRHREEVLNGYLLLHDAANAAGSDEAVACWNAGDPSSTSPASPVFWADYHELLAEFHHHAHSGSAV